MHKRLILRIYLGLELEDFTYQRKDFIIRIPQVYETIEKYNYVMYKNPDYSTKYYYAYITDIRYINDNMTEVTIKTDVFQTWQFDFIYMRSFVEREHVNSDNVGEHTIPEGLETGDYIINSTDYYDELDDCGYMVQTTEDWYHNGDPHTQPVQKFTNYGGIAYNGKAYFGLDLSDVRLCIIGLDSVDLIYNIYMIPKSIVNYSGGSPYVLDWEGQSSPNTDVYSVNKPSTINGYTPKNKKLFTYPYNYLIMSNNNGTSNILRYEKFSDSSCYFTIKGVPVVRWLY